MNDTINLASAKIEHIEAGLVWFQAVPDFSPFTNSKGRGGGSIGRALEYQSERSQFVGFSPFGPAKKWFFFSNSTLLPPLISLVKLAL